MNGDDDKLLDRYLAGDSDVSRRYREEAGDEVPPAAVDDRLRAAARREVKAGPRLAGLRPPAWTRPLAAVAMIVLAVGVVLQVMEENERFQFDDIGPTIPKAASPDGGDTGAASQSEPEAPEFEYKYIAPEGQAPAREPEPATAPAQEIRSKAATPGQAGDAAGGMYDDAVAPQPADDPQAWLERIRRLAEGGELETAREYLVRYRETFPGRPVPQELLDLLEPGVSGKE